MPVVVHDGVPLWESAALTLYLAETFGVERGLYPAPGTARGQAMAWVVWSNVTLSEAVQRFARNLMPWFPTEQQNAAAGELGKADLGKCLGFLDAHLAGKQFVVGDAYTLVDTHLHSLADWLRHLKIDFAPFEHVNAWSARCAARPAYVRVMASAQG